MRDAGKSKQLLDELSYLTDGFKSLQLNIRRTTGLDLANKILKEAFVVQIRPHSAIGNIFKLLSTEKDPVSSILR